MSCKARLARKHRFCPECGAEISKSTRSENKLRRQRVLPVDQDTLELVKQHLRESHSVLDNDLRPLFVINRHRVWQIVRDCARRAGLPDLVNPDTGRVRGISPHRLRDAFSMHAMKLDDSGDGLRLLQEHLGHANFNTTAKFGKLPVMSIENGMSAYGVKVTLVSSFSIEYFTESDHHNDTNCII